VIAKLLIANRGEIAVRIIRTARVMGVRTVAVYSDVDVGAIHTRLADEAVCLGEPEPSASYLNVDKILKAAASTGADAIHPGYGFLAESAEFADACFMAGLTFVGPPAAAMRKLGAKIEAKELAVGASVPVVPGYFKHGATPTTLLREAKKIGFPVMLKASAGGGGRGMRVVRHESDFLSELETASSEAKNAFGDGAMMLEKLIDRPRHIEVQILADAFGNVAALFERECSIQRRHQKLIEEAPAALLAVSGSRLAVGGTELAGGSSLLPSPESESPQSESPDPKLDISDPKSRISNLKSAIQYPDTANSQRPTADPSSHPPTANRQRPTADALWPALRSAAIALAKAAGYVGAGTVEFMVDEASGEFYFLEVNARLQVEHPVTEAVTGLDLVAWQLRIASGEPLDLPQWLMNGDRAAITGHAIEARIVAEDPAAGWLPSVGRIVGWAEPKGPGIRVDTGYGPGLEVPRYYDSLLAKVVAHGQTRAEALARLQAALLDFHILGVKTNIAYSLELMRHLDFIEGSFDTGFLSREFADWQPDSSVPPELAGIIGASAGPQSPENGGPRIEGAWDLADAFRNA
jgi:acetyl/propionyl-CoA carboxylase alpha subunit